MKNGGSGGAGRVGVAEASVFSDLIDRLAQGTEIRPAGTISDLEDIRILLESGSDSLLILGSGGRIVDANPGACELFCLSRTELLDSNLRSVVSEDYADSMLERLELLLSGTKRRKELIAFRTSWERGPVLECALSLLAGTDEPMALATLRDMATDKALFDRLRESKEHYAALSETITEAIFRLDEQFSIIFANSGVKNTFGFEREEVLGKNFGELLAAKNFAKIREDFRKYFYVDDRDREAAGLKRTIEILGVTKNRGIVPMELSFGNARDFQGRTLTCIVRDITQRKTMERSLRHLAYHDKLTALGNRDLFAQEVEELLRSIGDSEDDRSALLFLDLDGFKHINDRAGHVAGDAVLVEVSRRLRDSLRETDTAYRLGGDEFAVLLPRARTAEDALIVAQRILDSLAEPLSLAEDHRFMGLKDALHGLGLGVSIGVALIPEHGQNAEELLMKADVAMYCSKERGKGRCTVYGEGIETKESERRRIVQDMKDALVRGEFQLYYQPIVDLKGVVLGFEALTRWLREGHFVMSPSEFIPIAEEGGMIGTMGNWALRRACTDFLRLRSAGLPRCYISVNISGIQFSQDGFVDSLCSIIEKTGIDTSLLKIELTETAVMVDPAQSARRIREAKARCPDLAFMIDDFGTGYSSLSYLSQLPVEYLKIDMSFVKNIEGEQNRKIVNSILGLAASLGVRVVAEGIERDDQREYFRQRNCNAFQGFLFSQALSVEALMERLKILARRTATA